MAWLRGKCDQNSNMDEAKTLNPVALIHVENVLFLGTTYTLSTYPLLMLLLEGAGGPCCRPK